MNNIVSMQANTAVDFGQLSDRRFEEFVHRLFQFRLKEDLKSLHDKATLMSGVGERGKDISLYLRNSPSGIVQCKLNSSQNFNKPSAVKEIIKFVLHSIKDKSIAPDYINFRYYLVLSHKAANTTSELLDQFNTLISSEDKLDTWAQEVIKEYVEFEDFEYSEIKLELYDKLKLIKVICLQGSDLNGFINQYPQLMKEFFEVKTVLETQPVLETLDQISKQLPRTTEHSIFLDAYKRVSESYLSVVRFVGHATRFNKPQNMTIEKLYVKPSLEIIKPKQDLNSAQISVDESKSLTPVDILKSNKHSIVLGDPGAGKSLLVKSLFLDLLLGRELIPFRIELRKYIQECSKSNISIVQYLESLLKTEYQLQNVTINVLQDVIESKKCVFFFDGLDEIFDITQKEKAASDILNFCNNHSDVKCVITSRFIGFDDVEFDNNLFNKYKILPFNNEQVNEFIDNFFITQITSKSQRQRESEECKSQISSVSEDLKANPLILSLMSTLALNNVKIPDSRLEVYQSITETLVERRDKEEKALQFKVKNVRNLKATLSSLAFWQYQRNSEDKKVTNELAINHVAEYLIEKRNCDDLGEAKESACEFLKYAENRSIYFDNTFTHKTFSEYYTANYICMNYHNNAAKLAKRNEVIKKYLGDPSWHVVFELLFSMIDNQVDDYEVITELCNPQLEKSDASVLIFLLGQIKILNNMDRQLITRVLSNSLNLICNSSINSNSSISLTDSNDESDFYKLLGALAGVIKTNVKSTNQITQEIMTQIESELTEKTNFTVFYLLALYLKEDSDLLFYKNKNNLEFFAEQNLCLYLKAYLDSFSLLNALEIFGIEAIFNPVRDLFEMGSHYYPLVNIWLMRESSKVNHQEFIKVVESIPTEKTDSLQKSFSCYLNFFPSTKFNICFNLFASYIACENEHTRGHIKELINLSINKTSFYFARKKTKQALENTMEEINSMIEESKDEGARSLFDESKARLYERLKITKMRG